MDRYTQTAGQTDRHTDRQTQRQTDGQKRISKKWFSFSAHLIIHVGLIYLKNRKLQKIFGLQIYIQGVKNNVYNVSGMIEKVKTNMFFYLTKLWLMHRFAARWSYG